MHIYFFFFNDTATTEIYTLSLHDALPISAGERDGHGGGSSPEQQQYLAVGDVESAEAVVRGDCAKSEEVLIEPRRAGEVFHVQGCLQHTYDSRHRAPPW